MATKYTSVVNIQGNSRRRYRGYVSATVSNVDNDTSRITWSARVEMYNAAQYGVGVKCYVGGTLRKTDTGYLSSSPGTTYKTVASVSGTTDYTRGTSAKSVTVTVNAYGTTVSGYGSAGGSASASVTVTIPALPSYTVAYNANGGSGAPGNQTKWYGKTLTLSSTKPTRTGYTFNRWSTTLSGGTVYFNPGASYTYNSAATLYADWTANTWTVTYDANGGTGAPAAQTKTYGQTLTLSSTKPTRTNYNFLGWATSSTATTAQYAAGGAFDTNANVTLYAVWELAYTAPRITNLTADRCDSAGTLSDEGTYAKVSFGWATDKTVTGIKIVCNGVTTTVTGSGTSGSVSQVVGAGALSTENQYSVVITVTDSVGSSSSTMELPPLAYIIDFSPQGGVAIGEPAPDDKRFNIVVPTAISELLTSSGIKNNGSFENTGSITNSGSIVNSGTIETNHIYLRNNQALAGRLSSGDISEILRVNPSDQVELNWTTGGLKGRVFKKLWEGNWNGKSSISVPEIGYYNLVAVTGLLPNHPNTLGSTTRVLIPKVNSTRFEGNTCYWGSKNMWFIWFAFNASSNTVSTNNNAEDVMVVLTVNYSNWNINVVEGNITKIEGVL